MRSARPFFAAALFILQIIHMVCGMLIETDRGPFKEGPFLKGEGKELSP
jgi:hypothetical protein